MKDFLLKTLLNLKGEKMIRHGLTGLAGAAAGSGVVLNIDTLPGLLSTLIAWGLVVGWSAWRKSKPDAELADIFTTIASSAGAHLASLASGYLAAKGVVDPASDAAQTPASILLAVCLYALRAKHAPDVKKIVPLIIVCFTLASQTACVAARGEGWTYASLGTDSSGLQVSAMGMSAASMVQSTGVEKAGAAVVRNTMIGGLMRMGNTALDAGGDALLKAVK